jgi:GNAT superfamily N-acetyltransferase
VRLVQKPELDWYKQLFRAVGENWLWFSRLSMDDDSLREIIHNPLVEVHVLMRGLMEIGLMELDFRAGKDCELAYFGLTSDAIGTGAGQHLMQFAIERAWTRAPTIHLHAGPSACGRLLPALRFPALCAGHRDSR